METVIEGGIPSESAFTESVVQTDAEKKMSPVDNLESDAINGNEQKNLQQLREQSPQDEMDTSDNETPWREQNDVSNVPGKINHVPPSIHGRDSANAIPFARAAVSFGVNRQNVAPSMPTVGSNGTQMELWVETKTAEGKSYFYHALSRETTWTRPEGTNIKIMSQSEIEDMNKKQQQAHKIGDINATESTSSQPGNNADTTHLLKGSQTASNIADTLTTQPPNLLSQPPPTQQQQLTQPPPNVSFAGATHQPPPGMHHQPPPFFQPGMHPPNFGQTPFGMPPPGYGGYPGGHAPWGMPWNAHLHMSAAQQEKPAKNLILKPGVIDPAVIARAAEWSEHRAPDGRPYYYHAGRGESIWEKPQALRDMEAARMAAHSGATPQQAIAPHTVAPTTMPPHMHMSNQLMHMPPANAAAFDPTLFNAAAAAAAAAAATIKANESSKAAQAAALEKESKKVAEEKRKKEEEQKKTAAAAAAAAKPVDKSRPISSTPIAGTPWCVVWTGDARVFFYNPSTRTSVWERPEDLLDRDDVDKAVANTPEQLKSSVQGSPTAQKVETQTQVEKQKPVHVVEEEEMREDNEVINIRTESESSLDEAPAKKARLVTKQSKKSDANEAAAEAEQRAAKERAVVPLETRVKQFKDMLREKDVSAFSTWEKELHKIVFDPRYLLLTSKERKQVFEKYVKDRAEEERKEKRNKMRQKRDDFRKLMEDAKLHGKSSFSEFCQRFGKEERYKAIEKVRERESLFNEYIVDVRRREKEDKLLKKEQIRKEFLEMLRERSDIDRHTRWHELKKKFDSDARYRAVDSMYREEYFQDYMRIVKDEKRKEREQKDRDDQQRERDRKLERNKSDRKDKERGRKKDRERSRSRERSDKEKDRNKEKRLSKEKDTNKDKSKEKEKNRGKEKEKGKDKGRDSDKDKDKGYEKEREKDKNGDLKKHEYSDEGQHSASDEPEDEEDEDDETERLQKERDRQLRAELSIREREKEVLRTLAGHLRDRDKEREHHKRDEAIGHFNALLTDLVRNPDLTWKEVKRQLRKDHRWEMIETLDRDDREKIFNEHIDALVKKKREKFREMLDEIGTLELTSTWKDIKKLIKEDPRYLKYNNSDKCEREYRDYIKDKTLNAKGSLRELLQECKLITHKSNEIVSENPNHLKEIQDILKNDKRYLVLDHVHEERTTIVLTYLEELHKRGPPPPPTASESTRRNK